MNKKFKQFKNECLRLQKKWGLSSWKLYFRDMELKDCFASINTSIDGYVANVMYDSSQEMSNPKENAKHEMIHLVLSRMSSLARSRDMREEELYSAEEEVVRILEKLL